MKVFLCLAFCVLAVSALPIEENVDGWYVPQNDGSLQWMSIAEGEALLEYTFLKEGRLSTNPVRFFLYTKANPLKPQEIKTTAASVQASNFNSKNPTRFVIHGWGQSRDDNMNKEITKAWLSRGDFNVIIVDWARARSFEYASSVIAVGGAGDKVGEMIKFLNSNFGMSLSTLYVIGHSLGAHVSGYAGKNVGAGKIGTIVALDPALPLFSYEKPSTRLNSGDAVYVEAIQTNGGQFGFLRPIGKASFYPNGGQCQPGCGLDTTGACAHGRSIIYYAEAVTKNDFPTMKCSDYDAAIKKNCGATYSSVKMGSTTNPSSKINGDYYVPVNSKVPFGMAG